MNGTSLIAKVCAAAFFLGGAAWAESTSGLIDSTKLNDKKVTDLQGNELGKVDRLLVDPQSGQVRFAVIDVGSLLNQQGTEVAVPWQTLKVNREGGPSNFTVQLDASKEKLQSAPRFTEAEADRLFTPTGAEPVETYWTIIIPAPSSTASRPPEAGTTSPNQPSNVDQQGQSSQPSVTTPGEQGTTPSRPGSYYQKNRQRTAPSSTEQNNSPAGTQQPGAGRENQEGIPPREETTTSPEPTTTPEPSTSIPSESAPTSPDKGDTKNGDTSFPGEPSTTP